MESSTSSSDPVTVSVRVIERLAEETGADPLELPPLHESVDPDALDALFSPESSEPTTAEVTFIHYGQDVSVSYDGDVVITVTPA